MPTKIFGTCSWRAYMFICTRRISLYNKTAASSWCSNSRKRIHNLVRRRLGWKTAREELLFISQHAGKSSSPFVQQGSTFGALRLQCRPARSQNVHSCVFHWSGAQNEEGEYIYIAKWGDGENSLS